MYNLASLNISHHNKMVIQWKNLKQFKCFFSNLFEWYWQITKHSKAAVITSLRKTEFKCTQNGHTETEEVIVHNLFRI